MLLCIQDGQSFTLTCNIQLICSIFFINVPKLLFTFWKEISYIITLPIHLFTKFESHD